MDERKLPKWAQSRLAALRARIDDLEKANADIIRDETRSPFFIERFSAHGTTRRYIPASHVCIEDDNMELRVSVDEDGIDLMWQTKGLTRDVGIYPRASNHCYLRSSKAQKG